MEVVLPGAVIVLAASPAATALEASVAAIHPAAFPAGVTPVVSRAVATVAEAADNRAHRYFQKRTFRSSFFVPS